MNPMGIHVANARFRNYADFNQIRWQSFFLLHLNRTEIPNIRRLNPDARIIVRAYTPNWTQENPVEWARSIAAWVKELQSYRIELTFANEQNLAGEGHPLGAGGGNVYPPRQLYEDINNWNGAVITELRKVLPAGIPIHYPAISQGHSDDQNDAGYVGYEILRPSIELADILDVHTYWNGPSNRQSPYYGRRYEMAHALFPQMPLYISEFGSDVDMQTNNASDYALWLNELPDYITGAACFIWDSDEANAIWTIADKPAFVAMFKNFQYTPPRKKWLPLGGSQGFQITQMYGVNDTGIPDYYTSRGFNSHEGLDLVPLNALDLIVYALEDGVVVRDTDDPRADDYGIKVTVWNPKTGRAWWYCHLASNSVSLNQQIKAGDQIGIMGGTGLTPVKPHLHLGLRLADANGSALNLDNGWKGFIDPLPLVNQLNGVVVSQPIIKSFTATPATIKTGESATLTWSTENATAVDLDGKPVPLNGSVTVSPSQTTTYTLNAR